MHRNRIPECLKVEMAAQISQDKETDLPSNSLNMRKKSRSFNKYHVTSSLHEKYCIWVATIVIDNTYSSKLTSTRFHNSLVYRSLHQFIGIHTYSLTNPRRRICSKTYLKYTTALINNNKRTTTSGIWQRFPHPENRLLNILSIKRR